MSDEWRWIAPDGFEYSGSLDRLREALEDGKLPPTTEVWRAGLSEWLPARDVAELAASVPHRFTPLPELKTPPPVGISADAVVMRPPAGQMVAMSPPAPPVEAPKAALRPRSSTALRVVVPLVIGVPTLGAAIWAALAYASSREDAAAPSAALVASASPSAVPSAPSPASALRCSTHRTKPLAKSISGRVPIAVSASPGSKTLVVGFAETRSLAKMLTIDAETLAVEATREERVPAMIVGVVPLLGADQTRLAVDVADPRLRLARTIEAEPPFEIGIGPEGIAKLAAGGELITIWPGESEAQSTVPRVDGSAERGYFVTLRRGGMQGRVHGGWLTANGSKRSALGVIEHTGSAVGTPTAAVGPSGVLVAAAVRAASDAPWDVGVALAAPAELPQRLNVLATPRGAGVKERMSPAAAALGDGRWALQWTERTAFGHRVMVQLFDAKLAPASEPVMASPDGAVSGQGELWARADRLVSLFLVRSGTSHELWASVLGCR